MALYRNIAGVSGRVGLFLEQDTGLTYGSYAIAPLPVYDQYDSPIIDYMSIPATTAPVQQTTDIAVTDVTVSDTGAVTPIFTGDITTLITNSNPTSVLQSLTPTTTANTIDPTPAVPTPLPAPTTEQKLDWLPLAALAAAVAIALKGEAIVPKYKTLLFAGTMGVLYYGLQTHVK